MKKLGFTGISKCSFTEDKSMGMDIKLNKPQGSNLWAIEPERERAAKARNAKKERKQAEGGRLGQIWI